MSISRLSGSQLVVFCLLFLMVFVPVFLGIVWVEGWAIITMVNYLAQSSVLPATHTGYLCAGGLLTFLASVLKQKGNK